LVRWEQGGSQKMLVEYIENSINIELHGPGTEKARNVTAPCGGGI
jgi:hypothetical protein